MNLPNKITVFRFCCIPFLFLASYIQFRYHWVVALLVYFVACMSDKADGIIARKNGLVTDFGKVMDPLSDKTLVLAASNGEIIAANAFGKAKTFLQMSTTGITFLILAILEKDGETVIATNGFNAPNWLGVYCTVAFWIVGIVTLLSGIKYTKDGWHLIKTK